MSRASLPLSDEQILAALGVGLASRISDERLHELEERYISQRIGLLSMDQAQRHLSCKSPRQLDEFLRANKIPTRNFGRKKKFVLISDLEAAIAKAATLLPARVAVARVEPTTLTNPSPCLASVAGK